MLEQINYSRPPYAADHDIYLSEYGVIKKKKK